MSSLSPALKPYFICSVQCNASLFVYLSVGSLNSASASLLRQMTQATGGTRPGGSQTNGWWCVWLCLSEFLNINIDKLVQILWDHPCVVCIVVVEKLFNIWWTKLVYDHLSKKPNIVSSSDSSQYQCHTLGPLVQCLYWGRSVCSPPRYRSSYVWVWLQPWERAECRPWQ